MPADVERSASIHTVTVTDRAGVRVVAETRALLLEALEAGVAARVDLSGADSVDAAFAQLLTSADRTFRGASVPLEIVDPHDLLAGALPGVR